MGHSQIEGLNADEAAVEAANKFFNQTTKKVLADHTDTAANTTTHRDRWGSTWLRCAFATNGLSGTAQHYYEYYTAASPTTTQTRGSPMYPHSYTHSPESYAHSYPLAALAAWNVAVMIVRANGITGAFPTQRMVPPQPTTIEDLMNRGFRLQGDTDWVEDDFRYTPARSNTVVTRRVGPTR